MTKAEERKTLEQIAALIESAGEDSYIATAFAGCVAMAAENIDNDYMDSWMDRANRRAAELAEAKKEAAEAREAYALAVESIAGMQDDMREARGALQLCIEIASKAADEAAAVFHALAFDAPDGLLLDASRRMKQTQEGRRAAMESVIHITRRLGK